MRWVQHLHPDRTWACSGEEEEEEGRGRGGGGEGRREGEGRRRGRRERKEGVGGDSLSWQEGAPPHTCAGEVEGYLCPYQGTELCPYLPQAAAAVLGEPLCLLPPERGTTCPILQEHRCLNGLGIQGNIEWDLEYSASLTGDGKEVSRKKSY